MKLLERAWYTQIVEQDFKKKLWTNAGIIAGSFAVAAIVFSILGTRLDSLSREIGVGRNEAASRSYALENLSMLKTQEPEAAKYKEKLDALLPSQDGLFAFVSYIQGIGKMHQVDLTFSYSGAAVEPAAGQPGYIPFSATLSGSIENVTSFVDDIESKTSRFLVNFDGVDLSGESGGAYHAALKGKVFFK